MNKRFVTVLVFALAVSGLATFLIARVIQSGLSSASRQPTATILVAARDLPIGTLLKEGDWKATPWAGPVPQEAINKPEDLAQRGVISTIYTGEPIMDSRLAHKGEGAGLATMIPKGMRAVAVRVNEVVGVAGFVLPGMRVDVLVSGNPPNQTELGTETKTILQNIEVLSAGQSIQKDAENKPISVQVVNLLVTPEQAEALSLASNEARIQLVLRNPLDTDEATTPGTAMAYLFGRSYFSATDRARPIPHRTGSGFGHGSKAKVTPVVATVAPSATAAPVVITVEVLHSGKKEEKKFVRNTEVSQ